MPEAARASRRAPSRRLRLVVCVGTSGAPTRRLDAWRVRGRTRPQVPARQAPTREVVPEAPARRRRSSRTRPIHVEHESRRKLRLLWRRGREPPRNQGRARPLLPSRRLRDAPHEEMGGGGSSGSDSVGYAYTHTRRGERVTEATGWSAHRTPRRRAEAHGNCCDDGRGRRGESASVETVAEASALSTSTWAGCRQTCGALPKGRVSSSRNLPPWRGAQLPRRAALTGRPQWCCLAT